MPSDYFLKAFFINYSGEAFHFFITLEYNRINKIPHIKKVKLQKLIPIESRIVSQGLYSISLAFNSLHADS